MKKQEGDNVVEHGGVMRLMYREAGCGGMRRVRLNTKRAHPVIVQLSYNDGDDDASVECECKQKIRNTYVQS